MLRGLTFAAECWGIAAVVLAYPVHVSRAEDRKRREQTATPENTNR